MFYEIKCEPKTGVTLPDDVEDLLWQFLYTLQNNGQILKNCQVIKNENYSLYVSLPKSDSFDEKHDSPYVKRDRAKVNEYFNLTLVPLGDNVESQEYCSCEKRSAIEMQTYSSDVDSVFTCCDCVKPIALYELPLNEGQEDYYEIISWQENYSSMDKIWMNCLCDRLTGKQLTSVDSALNEQGLGIAEYLRKKLGCKVYYNMFDDLGFYGRKSRKWVKVGKKTFRICPKCGSIMKYFENGIEYKRMLCEECELSSSDYED